jgi:tetratricopeptide (TPR) repeat protein
VIIVIAFFGILFCSFFSRDFLIALWFASHGSQDTDGKVLPYIVMSPITIRINLNGFFVSLNCLLNVKTIEILQKDKQLVLQELSDIFSIDEKSLFQDIHGFSMVNDANHPIYEKTAEEYIEKGNNNYHKSEFERAIEAYKKAIEINPNSDMAYSSMGRAYYKLDKIEWAIEACKKAIDLNPALIIHNKQQNWHPLETWINNLTDNDKKQQYLHTLKRLKNGKLTFVIIVIAFFDILFCSFFINRVISIIYHRKTMNILK